MFRMRMRGWDWIRMKMVEATIKGIDLQRGSYPGVHMQILQRRFREITPFAMQGYTQHQDRFSTFTPLSGTGPISSRSLSSSPPSSIKGGVS